MLVDVVDTGPDTGVVVAMTMFAVVLIGLAVFLVRHYRKGATVAEEKATPVEYADPNDAEERRLLTEPASVHETGGVLRMLRAGWTGPQIIRELGGSDMKVRQEMKFALDAEGEAAHENREIFDAKAPKGYK